MKHTKAQIKAIVEKARRSKEKYRAAEKEWRRSEGEIKNLLAAGYTQEQLGIKIEVAELYDIPIPELIKLPSKAQEVFSGSKLGVNSDLRFRLEPYGVKFEQRERRTIKL